ncbi:MAG: tellurite resistance/C4-dicarboxylate transporter family protein [Gammaproteobacteria bacterium]|nr:tellurite resistance/C4-dicarboxylate transporter family protein [Gammaproteobacteria bacterium]MDH5629016.1 tellurite resistance/C4-dicarboxylate transporter family protein [Gammaproteobacteria bacterium]
MTENSKNWLHDLYPGYFAMTMATGIITIAFDQHGFSLLYQIMAAFTFASWFVLFCLYTWRLFKYPKAVFENLSNPKTTFMFFTFVAATDICGMVLLQFGFEKIAMAAWAIAFVYWSALLYFGFAFLCFAHREREVNVVHGGWLILIVGTQSLVILGAKIAPLLGKYAAYMMIEIHMLWALGMIFYAIFVTLFCYRIFFMNMEASDYSPLMWVIMGAAAISANAGSNLILTDPVIPLFMEMRSVVQMFSIMLWTWATWWIPLLVIIGIWKHIYLRVPLKYEPMQWSIVFPLGMYTVATENLALSAEFHPLIYLSMGMLWVAAASWFVLMIFFIRAKLFNAEKKEAIS